LRDHWGEASSLRNLGRVHGDVGRFEEALDCSQHSLEIERASGHRWGEALSLEVLGHALFHTEGMEAARPYWEAALQIFTELGAPEAEEVRARLDSNT
jgi:tetratricopeptide (TPR) repeat protein